MFGRKTKGSYVSIYQICDIEKVSELISSNRHAVEKGWDKSRAKGFIEENFGNLLDKVINDSVEDGVVFVDKSSDTKGSKKIRIFINKRMLRKSKSIRCPKRFNEKAGYSIAMLIRDIIFSCNYKNRRNLDDQLYITAIREVVGSNKSTTTGTSPVACSIRGESIVG